MLGFFPGLRFAIGDNRPEGDAEVNFALVLCRFSPHPLHRLLGLSQRFAPQGKDVGVLTGHPNGGL